MVKRFLARSRLLTLLALAVLALGLLVAVTPGHPVVHAQSPASALQAATNDSTVAISVTIGADTGQTFAASQVALGGKSLTPQGTGAGGQGQFTASPITVDRLVDQLSPLLWADLATGKSIDLVTIDFMATSASGRAATPFETIKLQNVLVTDVQDVAQSQGFAETITLIYDRITITAFDANGAVLSQFTFDVQQGVGS
ncbi:MAG TPA: type VI secretion system tube protein Hcp [Ktedonobacterales bacterium]|jgi:type VI protein secretion system component Hcp